MQFFLFTDYYFMCGIAGIIGNGSEEQLKVMVDTIKHRGPDDQGFLVDNKKQVYLGMRRLSIIDIARGKQPIFNEDKRIGVIYNGEIYNYQPLRETLTQQGHIFKTQSDTEVIVHGYEEWGNNVFTRLNGMFAIAIWDNINNQLVITRDRVGEKPLYYALVDNVFYFASELKVFNGLDVRKQIDREALIKFFDQTYSGGCQSIYKEVKKLGAGEYLIFKNGIIAIKKYWELPHLVYLDSPTKSGNDKKMNKVVDELDTLLSDAVKIRLMSEVPLGVFLSGGLDSSLIAYYAQKHTHQNIKTFTVSFDDQTYNEANHAEEIAQHLNTNHTTQRVSDEEVLSIIDRLPEIMDEPFADTSLIPTYWLCKKTREHVTVALSGDGADELFMGYQTFQAWGPWQWLKFTPGIILSMMGILVSQFPNSKRYFGFDFKLKQGLLRFDHSAYNQHFRWYSPFSKKELQKLFINLEYLQEYFDYKKSWGAELYNNPQDQSAHLYQKYYLPDDIFTKVDRASMAVSLETRAPFVDYRLIEFVNSLPQEYKYHKRETKYILKKLAERYLPKDIIYRKKHGFAAPVDTWLRGPLREKADHLFNDSLIKKQGLLNGEYMQYLWKDFLNGNNYRARQMWILFCWQLWNEKYMK